jgi:hypothetical protein
MVCRPTNPIFVYARWAVIAIAVGAFITPAAAQTRPEMRVTAGFMKIAIGTDVKAHATFVATITDGQGAAVPEIDAFAAGTKPASVRVARGTIEITSVSCGPFPGIGACSYSQMKLDSVTSIASAGRYLIEASQPYDPRQAPYLLTPGLSRFIIRASVWEISPAAVGGLATSIISADETVVEQ